MCSVLNRSFISSLQFHSPYTILIEGKKSHVGLWAIRLSLSPSPKEQQRRRLVVMRLASVMEWWQRLYRHVLLFSAFHSATFTFPSFTSADLHILESCVCVGVDSDAVCCRTLWLDCVLCVWHNVNGTRNVKDMILTEMCASASAVCRQRDNKYLDYQITRRTQNQRGKLTK